MGYESNGRGSNLNGFSGPDATATVIGRAIGPSNIPLVQIALSREMAAPTCDTPTRADNTRWIPWAATRSRDVRQLLPADTCASKPTLYREGSRRRSR